MPLGYADYWNGSSWEQKPAKVWNGSSWVQVPVRFWNGSEWRYTHPSGLTLYPLDSIINNVSTSTQMTRTSNSFTPPNNSLLCVIGMFATTNDTKLLEGTMSITDSLGLTWTKRLFTRDINTGNYAEISILYTTPITTGEAMTTTINSSDLSGGDGRSGLMVFALTGYKVAVPLGGTAVAAGIGGGVFSMDLDTTPDANSVVFGARSLTPNGSQNVRADPGAGFTEVYDFSRNSGYLGMQLQYKTGSVSPEVAWTDVATGGTSDWTSTAIGFEVRNG